MLNAVSGRLNIKKINLIDLIFMGNNGELSWVFESHFANSERP
jgi:hypothetical protein